MFARVIAGLSIAVLVHTSAGLRAEEIGNQIDLTAFGQIPTDNAPEWHDVPLLDVSQRLGTAPRRFYLSFMIGPSFARFDSPVEPLLSSSESIFDAGGALGVAFERNHGQLRLEVEGMGRGTYDTPFDDFPDTNTVLTNNWSVMTNLWRDIMLTKHFGIYGGGGIGAGGYILGIRTEGAPTDYIQPGGNFAWQAGGGVLWQISDRLTFDVGYRYFQISAVQQTVDIIPNQFQSSELMFTLRLYEPFRGLLR
jgi:opacity protein-like surface antigen